mmetsp:Transcript_56409/g.115422  ORF Transcript_56409/g.115422 Transcript_56409/m.115422 type:complete len:248 (-) Transcript_56409:552-1295(-)
MVRHRLSWWAQSCRCYSRSGGRSVRGQPVRPRAPGPAPSRPRNAGYAILPPSPSRVGPRMTPSASRHLADVPLSLSSLSVDATLNVSLSSFDVDDATFYSLLPLGLLLPLELAFDPGCIVVNINHTKKRKSECSEQLALAGRRLARCFLLSLVPPPPRPVGRLRLPSPRVGPCATGGMLAPTTLFRILSPCRPHTPVPPSLSPICLLSASHTISGLFRLVSSPPRSERVHPPSPPFGLVVCLHLYIA